MYRPRAAMGPPPPKQSQVGVAHDAYARRHPERVSNPKYEAEEAVWCSGYLAALIDFTPPKDSTDADSDR